MDYPAWRITFQSSEQAARAAFNELLIVKGLLAEARQDAERYRWLRKHLVNWCPDDDTARLSWNAREVLDAEIDAAMKGANG